MTDNASEFRPSLFPSTIRRLNGHHVFIRPGGTGGPQTNGCVERVQRTILEECWRPAFARYLIPRLTGLRLDLQRYLHYYNTDLAHTGRLTTGRTPEQVIGKVKLWTTKRCVARSRDQISLDRIMGLIDSGRPRLAELGVPLPIHREQGLKLPRRRRLIRRLGSRFES